MKKLLPIFLILLLVASMAVSCKNDKKEKEDTETKQEEKYTENTKVIALKGPTGMGMAKMITDNDSKYTFEIASSPDDAKSAIISGSVDIAAIPTNLASVLYNKTNGGIKVLALNTEGVLYILDATGTINSVEDLRGKTIGATGQGSTPEYILRFILKENGIDPDNDVTLQFYSEHAELATLMAEGKVEIGMLPEPNVTTALTKNSNLVKALSLTEEWNKVAPESALVQGCIVARTEFIEQYPDSVKVFLSEYEASVNYIKDADDASALIANLGIVPAEAIAKKALPSCNICYYDSNSDLEEKLSGFLEVLYSFNPAAVGGKLPDSAFYYENR